MIEVENKVPVYEVDGEDTIGTASDLVLIVHHHWSKHQFVVLKIGGHEYTVVASNIIAAIINAQNVDE